MLCVEHVLLKRGWSPYFWRNSKSLKNGINIKKTSLRAVASNQSSSNKSKHTVASLTNVSQLDLNTVKRISALLATVFYVPSSFPAFTPLLSALYGYLITWNICKTLVLCGGNAACMIAVDNGLDQVCQHESRSAIASWSSFSSRFIAGMGTVHMVQLYGIMAEALKCNPGTPFALVANMAVQPDLQGRGIGRSLMSACEEVVRTTFKPKPPGMLLLVYKDNEAAISLYKSEGYRECASWVDPNWLEDAERGRIGRPRRLLFVKEFQTYENCRLIPQDIIIA